MDSTLSRETLENRIVLLGEALHKVLIKDKVLSREIGVTEPELLLAAKLYCEEKKEK